MIKLLLEKAISQNNPFMSKETLALQIEFFATAGKITEEDRVELLSKLYPEMLENPVE